MNTNNVNANKVGFKADYEEETLTFEQIGELRGQTLLEFGASWCPHCQESHSTVKAIFTEHSALSHIKIADGKGKRLGRQFKVKLWPTLILIQDGHEVARIVRPQHSEVIRQLMSQIK